MSSHSPRSQRVREEARNRPDKVWLEKGQIVEAKYQNPESSNEVLSGGTELAKLIAESDAHLVAMRKIVR
jgi:hypothetical protein